MNASQDKALDTSTSWFRLMPAPLGLWRDRQGGVAVILALLVPALVGMVSAGTEYASALNRQSQLQAAADTAALGAAKGLALTSADDQVVASAKTIALQNLQLTSTGIASAIAEAAVINSHTSVTVTIRQSVPIMMGHYLGTPTIDLGVTATATLSGNNRKICAIGLEPALDGTIRLDQDAKLTALGCDVLSNSSTAESIKTYRNSYMKAGRICSSGGYKSFDSSYLSPRPTTDCPPLPDPLASRAPPLVGGCDYTDKVVSKAAETLNPGRYCGGLRVTFSGKATLNPGVYIISDGHLRVETGSTIEGTNVGFYLHGALSTIDFGADTTINLTAPKSGTLAGILFFEDRDAPLLRKHSIISNNARNLLGTIYLSRGLFYVGAKSPVADQSAYTVIVARSIQMDAGPNLVLNTNYFATDVPVPQGVGSNSAGVVGLTR